ncbi:DnaJ C-terminal domain-containing protein [Streptomyces shenzhenensis]|nr:DnaJ C-terminal domain-containing protein [Streptomyces shenzhenensis]
MYKVRIPAGIRDGQDARIHELGGPGKHGGAHGDLYVTVCVAD